MNSYYTGDYTKGSDAGGQNNILGKEAEEIVEAFLQKLGYEKDKSYYTQRRIPYLSPDRFRTISTSFIFPENLKKLKHFDADKFSLFLSGGPNIVEDFIVSKSNIDVNDEIFPISEIQTIISVTQANPTKPGHSIENKLHQALGELFLHKTNNPSCRSIIFIGGTEESWGTPKQLEEYGNSYSLETIKLFYDDCICAWETNLELRFEQALNCKLSHQEFWNQEQKRARQIDLYRSSEGIPNKNLRLDFLEHVIYPEAKKHSTKSSEISNSILKFMFEKSKASNGKFHSKLTSNDKSGLSVDRSFNNPPEAAVCMLLDYLKIPYKSDYLHGRNEVLIKKNLLYDLGYKNMHRYTDFIIESKDGTPIFIECKSSGGGFEGGHKHITDRAREQIARSLLKRTKFDGNKLLSGDQYYQWIFILDADWETPKNYPQKFIHTLQFAGATKWFSASDLVDENFELKFDNPFVEWLKKVAL